MVSSSEASPIVSTSTLVKPRRTFEALVEEEIPIQKASIAMEGGVPSCMSLFDNFLLCYC